MNYIDYENWAEEYRQQVEVLDRKLKGRHRRNRRFATAEQRTQYENTTRIFEEMRRDCASAFAILKQRAEEIKEEEQRAESIVAQ